MWKSITIININPNWTKAQISYIVPQQLRTLENYATLKLRVGNH
jgi:hypothetical protein